MNGAPVGTTRTGGGHVLFAQRHKDFVIPGGSVGFDGKDGALLTAALPPVMTIQAEKASSIAWLLSELDREGNSTARGTRLIGNDLLRLIFVQVLCIHLSSPDATPQNWLSG